MPRIAPLDSSGARDAAKRRASLPAHVRHAILLLVHGDPNDEQCRALGLADAARLAGMRTDQLRRWLQRSEARAMVRSERKVAIEAISAGNPGALQRVRDKVGGNQMASVAAARAIEDMRAVENGGGGLGGGEPRAGVCIRIVNVIAGPGAPSPPTIEGRADRALGVPYAQQPPIELPEPVDPNPIFRPPR